MSTFTIRPADLEEIVLPSAVLAVAHIVTLPHEARDRELQKITARFAEMPSVAELDDEMQIEIVQVFVEAVLDELWRSPDGAAGTA